MRSYVQITHTHEKQHKNKHAARTALLAAFGVRLFQEHLITTIKNHFEHSNICTENHVFQAIKKLLHCLD